MRKLEAEKMYKRWQAHVHMLPNSLILKLKNIFENVMWRFSQTGSDWSTV